jgi:endonuclease-3
LTCGDVKGHLIFWGIQFDTLIRAGHIRQGIEMAGSRKADPMHELEERKKRTAEIARRLRSFIKTKSSRGRDSTFIDTLVATILSQNTSDVNSARAYRELLGAYSSWDEVADADRYELAQVIRSGGLADQKSRTIIDVLNAIRERYGSFEPPHLDATPDDELLKELTAMKGIGVKTAACVLMFALGRDVCAVDTHVHRIVNRLGIVHASNPDKTFHELRPLVPKGKAREFHIDLIRFGRNICKAQRPHCFECPLYDLCRWEHKEAHAAAQLAGPSPVSGDLLILDIVSEVTGSRRGAAPPSAKKKSAARAAAPTGARRGRAE